MLGTSCTSKTDPEAKPTDPKAALPKPAPGVAAKDAPDEASGAASPSLHAHMQEHFVRVDQLQKAIVAGDLDAARAHAEWVASHEPHEDLPKGWEPHVRSMRSEAQTVASARTLSVAALATARVAGTCGSCHAAYDASLRLGAEPEPEMGTDAELAMQRHQWAADRMWDAVVSRSDELWQRGVAALDGAVVVPEALSGEPSADSQLAQVVSGYEALAPRARAAATPEARVEVLGDYLATCTGCHEVAERGPEAW